VKPAAKPRVRVKKAAAPVTPLPAESVSESTPVVESPVPATPPKKRGGRKPTVTPTVEPTVAEVPAAKVTRRRARST
jgi:hypothetical protein